jgi:hypothetical protein
MAIGQYLTMPKKKKFNAIQLGMLFFGKFDI